MNHKIKRITPEGFVIPAPIEGGKRFNWLSRVIKERGYMVGAEIGVARGNTTSHVMSANPSLKLYAVDLFAVVPAEIGGGTQYRNWNFRSIKSDFHRKTDRFKNRLTVLQGISWEMANKVMNGTLDFVFIDADHEYESCVKDIKAWTPKLKPGGMMSGHDTHFEGVKKAIDEIIPNWQAVGVDHCWEAVKEDVKC